ncbi:GNAT family N-acetyltransferase [Janthinobacterium agaricidamnosum]|uniref:Acetyltransferase family protein n=1 Tax=Janthinobacterium agaricidamnosum NBRC 102515 = DSM 9628 TaxID=1349767 RepID=W0UYS0_9BURK|nr:GNAT family N-acetyltransferase [Janthinobacterium agaricidamnosum]CDG81714.1 acetyltransferase family protein [Janthinobacterium agaricidamnosum NBRC 102515 = DSM 9628]
MKEIEIRPAQEADFEAMWGIFQQLVANGDTYTFGPDTSKERCHAYWFGPGVQSFVAVMGSERLLGMYKLIPNQAELGNHVANASFMVDPAAQGVGVGKLLGVHCMEQARQSGYLAMQFNFVVSTNIGAVMLWKKLGFTIIGTLPMAFRHAQLGYVDAYVMYQLLSDPSHWPG